MDTPRTTGHDSVTRRAFIKASAAATALIATAPHAFAGGADTLRVGLVGCGGRGRGAVINCLQSSSGVELVALGDLFPDQVSAALERFVKDEKYGNRVKVSAEHMFSGFDAYRNVIDADVDIVILASPPHFRPRHFAAAVEGKKHVFMEKPVAVDPGGVKTVIAAAERAKALGLGVAAGTQRRHQAHYLEVMKRVHGGAIGEITSASCYWNMGALWQDRAAGYFKKWQAGDYSDMEYQCRNWLFHTWLSGDHIVEQHVHNLDVVNWAIGSHPVRAMGMGGRQTRTEPQYGNGYDHFAVEYVYPEGQRVLSMCRQVGGASSHHGERVVGTKGCAETAGGYGRIVGANPFTHEEKATNPYVQEHADLIASIRAGAPINEGRTVAESTMTAILGRMSAYTGREIKWKWAMNASKLDLTPAKYALGDLAVEPVAIPGTTKLL